MNKQEAEALNRSSHSRQYDPDVIRGVGRHNHLAPISPIDRNRYSPKASISRFRSQHRPLYDTIVIFPSCSRQSSFGRFISAGYYRDQEKYHFPRESREISVKFL